MHSGGYLDRNVNKAGTSRLAIVIGLHGAAIAALMLAPAELIQKPVWTVLRTYPVDDTPPPPPENIPPPAEQQAKPENIERPTTIVPIAPTGSDFPVFPQTPPVENIIAKPPLPPMVEPVIREASFINSTEIQPDYPMAMARQEIEGFATVRILIGVDGRVKDVRQVSATDPEFFQATERQALRRWKFKPATRDGVPVESWRQMTVRFKLNG